ncbi:hypothetical protein V6U90_08010 [Micromonospora sp. CPCC 206060]|uniref:hypothetical protein n=1 Tax=Micromonospora sp. CPCC 206060 TaxID=3122406 RepID=UPI002FEEBAEE
MSGYYLAPALATLRDEINRRWPHRDRTSDGWIGDTAHQAEPSDHNPNSRGSVDALDIDADGVHMPTIIAAVQRHPSAHYWIWQRTIADADDGWRPREYTGRNPHDKHMHVSIRQTRTAEQDRRPWLDDQEEEEMTEAQIVAAVRKGVHGLLKEAAAAAGMETAGEPTATGRQVRDYVTALVDRAVDEPTITAGVVAALDPAAFAAALPHDLAERVAAELADRLAS